MPRITDIFRSLGSFFRTSPEHTLLSGDHTLWYSLGRWALTGGVRMLTPPHQTPSVWVPEYICREVPEALMATGGQTLYYPITSQLLPDWDWFEENAFQFNEGELLLLVHYFGIVNDSVQARTFCDRKGLFLIEDAAHCLPMKLLIEGMAGEAIVFSPRKLLPLPGDGILILRDIDSQVRLCSRQPSLRSSGQAIGWLIRRLIRRMMATSGLDPDVLSRSTRQSFPRNRGLEISPTLKPNYLSRCLICQYLATIGQILVRRRANYLLWQRIVQSLDSIKPLFSKLPENVCPYVFPMIVQNNQKSVLDQLRRAGVPASTWPELPDQVLNKKSSSATKIKNNLITLPVHQDLTKQDILQLGHRLQEIINKRIP